MRLHDLLLALQQVPIQAVTHVFVVVQARKALRTAGLTPILPDCAARAGTNRLLYFFIRIDKKRQRFQVFAFVSNLIAFRLLVLLVVPVRRADLGLRLLVALADGKDVVRVARLVLVFFLLHGGHNTSAATMGVYGLDVNFIGAILGLHGSGAWLLPVEKVCRL